MSKENELILGQESERVENHLEKLLPHLEKGGYILVGGIAIRHHLAKQNIDYTPSDLNDIDIVAKDLSVVKPTVTQDFIIYHYHPETPGEDSFFIALVHPESRTKVDIFSKMHEEETETVSFKDWDVQLVLPEYQLVKTVYDISRIAENDKVDPKQFEETTLLQQIVDMQKAQKIWEERNYEKYPRQLADAIKRAEQIRQEHSSWVQKHPFRREKPYVCQYCKSTLEFPVAPMVEVYKILGYVE